MSKYKEYKGKSKKQGKKEAEDVYDLDKNQVPAGGSILASRYIQILLALTIIGAILRFYHLDFNSLWLDEASTLTMSKPSLDAIWGYAISGDFHPPLFHWIEHFMLMFGQSEFVIRFIPAVLGTLTIPVFYLIGKEFRDENVGIISAALLTVSYFGIYYSQEAYSYALVLFTFSLVILFYLRALRTNSIVDWVLFGIASALAFWTHYYVVIPIGVIYLHALLSIRERLKESLANIKHMVIAFAIMTVFIIPLIMIVIERYQTLTAAPPTYGVLGVAMIPETILRLSGGYSPFNWVLAIIYIGIMLIGFAQLFTENKNRFLLSGMVLVIPLIMSVIISAKMTMNPRYLIYLMPVFYVMIAMSYPVLFRLIPNKKLLYGVLAIIVAINAPLLVGYYSEYTKEDWRGFAKVVEGVTRDGDIVVVMPGYIYQPFTYYYSNATDKTMRYSSDNSKDLEKIFENRGNNNIFYVVTGDISAADPSGGAVAWLQQNTQPVTSRTGIYLLVTRTQTQ